MKRIYLIYDVTAEEFVTPFFANNDEHAKKILQNQLQKQPQDIEFKVYLYGNVVESFFENLKPIFEYPMKAENSVSLKNENIDKIMEE